MIFELGLFFGRLGNERSFFIQPRSSQNIRIPTDLLGVTPLTFDDTRSDQNWQEALGEACDQIRQEIQRLDSLHLLIRPLEVSEGKIGYSKTAPKIYDHGLRLYNYAERRVRVLQSFPGPRPPEDYAIKAADILREKKEQHIGVLFEAYLAFDFRAPPPNFKQANEERAKVYERAGVQEQVSLHVLNVLFQCSTCSLLTIGTHTSVSRRRGDFLLYSAALHS